MPKVLYIGDPHATKDDLDDCHALIQLAIHTVKAEDVEYVVFLGDQYHNHAIIHVEVMGFWMASLEAFSRLTNAKVVSLVGNHDRPGTEGALVHAMMAHKRQCQVVDEPNNTLLPGILFVPYMARPEDFVEVCKQHALSPRGVLMQTAVCHQTFNGVIFDNGFEPSDGVDPNLLPQKQVISGHIHKPQENGKVWYPGAPRWRTLSDANVERAIWVVQHDDHGKIQDRKAYSTGAVCRQIRHLVDTPENPIQAVLDPRHRWQVDIRGPSDYVEHRKAELSGPGIRIRTFKTVVRQAKVRESDGMSKAFGMFLDKFQPPGGTDKSRLKQMVEARVTWR